MRHPYPQEEFMKSLWRLEGLGTSRIHISGLNPDCAVDTYCGFKSLAVTLVSLLSVASLSPTLSGRVPGFTILILSIFMNMPAVQNRSNFASR